MKFLTLITLTMLSLSTFADGENFDKAKEMMLTNIDKRIALVQAHKSCVSAAADKAALKACHEKHNADLQSLRSDRKTMKEQFKSERKERKTSKKSN
jgi:Skp family chaperone for outer membrane proteins